MGLAIDSNAKGIQCLRLSTTEAVTSTGTASNATAVAANVNVVRIAATDAINFSLVGTATTSSVYLPAGAIEYIRVVEGDVFSLIGSATVYLTVAS